MRQVTLPEFENDVRTERHTWQRKAQVHKWSTALVVPLATNRLTPLELAYQAVKIVASLHEPLAVLGDNQALAARRAG